MSSFIANRIKSLYRYGDTTPATLASIGSSFLWALCLIFPGTLIGPPGVGRPTYKYMYDIATEEVWIGVFLSIFVLQIWRIFCDQNFKNRLAVYLIEVAIKCWAAMVWTFIALACMIAQYPPAAAMSDAVIIACLCWWDFLRCEARPQQCLKCFTDHHCVYIVERPNHDAGH